MVDNDERGPDEEVVPQYAVFRLDPEEKNMTKRQEVHSLVDRLAPSQLVAVRSLLEVMLDPVSRAVANAADDDEPETEQERQAVGEATEWLQHNQPIPFEEVLSDFGMTPEDLKHRKEPE